MGGTCSRWNCSPSRRSPTFSTARRRGGFGVVTPTGAYFDPIADKCLLSGVFLALAAARIVPRWLVGIIFGRDLLILGGVACPVVYIRPPLPAERLGEGIHLRPDFDGRDVDGPQCRGNQDAECFGDVNAMALRGFYGVERAGLRQTRDPNCTSALTARAQGE